MARNTACTIFIGNMDEKVTERVLYEILIQAGNIVDLHIPRDKESNKHKGYAFAEYETEEVANYAVKLFSGLVRLRNKTLRFAMSGQDKPLQKSASPASSHLNYPLMQRLPASPGTLCGGVCSNEDSLASSITRNDATAKYENDPLFHHRNSTARGHSNGSFEYSRRVIGSVINGATHSAVPHNSVAYPFY